MKEYFYAKKGLYYRMNTFERGRPTLVFIHGLSTSSSAWITFEERLKDHYNLLFFDLRGHGKSVKPASYAAYAISQFADDVFELLQYLSISSCILVSHSFGTLIALEFLASHQAMVTGVVFLSPSARVRKGWFESFVKKLLDASLLLQWFRFDGTPRGHVNYANYAHTGDWNVRRLWADIRTTSLRSYAFASRQVARFDRSALLEHIHIPVLIIHGTEDSIFPVEDGLYMHEHIPRSELILIPAADHTLVLNNADEISQYISRFVDHMDELVV
jgi:pimeloyl-ACP methyl ester carboxylesterase